MADEAVKFGATQSLKSGLPPTDKKVFGVANATVINNVDCKGEARLQLSLPWLPGFTPWARIATPMAGMGRGAYFMPQVGDEVLVAFNHGDVREPYVLGGCWNTIDQPPSQEKTDPITKRKIRTPLGHELSFDEAQQSVTLTSNTKTTVTLDATQARLSTPAGSVTIGMAGDVTITSKTKITLDAPIIEIKAKSVLNAQGTTVGLKASGTCSIQGATVKIN